jgi:hypothetical protein
MLGEYLHQLTAKEEQITHLGWFVRNGIIAATGVTVKYAKVQVPRGFYLLMKNLLGIWEPNAGEAITDQGFELLNPENQSTAYELYRNPIAPFARSVDRQYSDLLIPPEWIVAAWGTFAPGVAANTVRSRVHGILIPQGNIQFFNMEGLGF